MTRPNPLALWSVNTPPVTDLDYSSNGFDTEGSDFVSENDVISEVDEAEILGEDEFVTVHRSTAERTSLFSPDEREDDPGYDQEAADSDFGDLADSIDGLESRARLLSISAEGSNALTHRSRFGARRMSPHRSLRSASSPSPVRHFPLPRRRPVGQPQPQPAYTDPPPETSLPFWTFVFT